MKRHSGIIAKPSKKPFQNGRSMLQNGGNLLTSPLHWS
jgi:hypothetical protein